ncbi:MAG: tRNA (adenosine(37)-N6)-threonylcarbamoyltransferase complex ATPase subunit type 1 TsaE [Anaerolineae bacterium]|nr:tRNA (adenosine(37)-N6)-threonylcarbamoyltransferase complex ATPase subunit type 1 TsaE [Gloeobacterales cyanobacterium ES-bin-313]
MKILLSDTEATRQLGKQLAQVWRPPTVLLFEGNLGAGKTTCVQGIAAALGITDPVTSPTFTLIEEYGDKLIHMDLYRLAPFEVEKLGLEEMWERGALVAIEWSERLSLLPEDYLRITFTNAEPRQAAFVAFGIAAEGYLQRLKPLLL